MSQLRCMTKHDSYRRSPSRTYSYDGDGGALVSIGLLRSIPFAKMEDCILRQWNSGEKTYVLLLHVRYH